MQLNSSTNAAHGEKAICLRRPSPTVAQLEDHREESINFYGGLVQRSHREANFSPQESSLAGTPCELPLHDDTSCSAPRRQDTAPSGKEGAGVGVCSPFLSLASVEDDTSWMNTTTTMVESSSSCTPSTPIDWWKVEGSMFMDEGGTHHMAGLKAAALATAPGSCNSSSDSTGERFPLNARKTASADVCRLELDKSPRRRSFGGAETSVTVHGVCNKTINGGSGGGNSGKFSSAEPIGSAMTSPPAPPASGCSGSGTVAAGTTAATGTIAQQLHHQRTLKTQRDHSSIRNSGNNSSTSGRSGRQQTNIAVVGGNIHLVAHDDGCHQFLSAPSTANYDDDDDHDDDDELSSLTTPLFLPEVDWTNETCIGGGLDFSSSIVVSSSDEQRLLQQQQQQQKQQLDDQHQHLWISSPASSSSNITDSELERRLEEYEYRATREDGQQQHLLSISQLELPQLGGNNSSSVGVGGAKSTLEQTVDCNNLLLTGAMAKEVGEPQAATIFITGSPVSLHEEIEQLSSGFDCDATNHLVSTGPSAAQLSFIVDDEPDHFQQQQQHGSGADSLSLNIFKWLQEDISSSILVDKQQLSSSSAAANTNLLEGADVPSSGVSYLLANDSTEISFSPSPASNHLLQQPVLEEPFENSLDQIQTLHRTTPVSGAGGGHKTAIKSEPSFVLVKGNHSHTTTTAAATTTTTTNTSAVNPQYDHNYSTIKRRNQDSGDQAHNHLKPKMLKLSNDHQQEGQQTTSRYAAAKDSTTVKVTARSTEDSYWRTVQPGIAQTTVNTNAASSTGTTTTKTKLSVAHRKAPTLKVHLGGGVQPPSILSMQDPFLLLNKALHPTTTTTTTTTGTTNIFGHRMPPQATLNTPDLTNDILDLEDEKFDLLSFIDTNDDSLDLNKYNSVVDEKPTLDDVLPSASRKEEEEETEQKADTANGGANSSSSSNGVKDSTELKIPQLLTLDSLRQLTASTEESQASTSSPSGRYRAQHHHLSQYGGSNSNYSIGSRSSASSVCGDSDVSSNTTTTQTPKRRGRPPKAVGTVRDRSQYEHLSEADWRYREQRDKNNEASRKSRINRKDRELKLESEADRLNLQHQKLSYEERRLQRDCQKWRKAVMKLALL